MMHHYVAYALLPGHRGTDDPYNPVLLSDVRCRGHDCFVSLWNDPVRYLDNARAIIPTSITDLDTVRLYAEWLRDLEYDARLVSLDKNNLPARTRDQGYGIELQWAPDDLAGKVFTGLCLIRFLTDENRHVDGTFTSIPDLLTSRYIRPGLHFPTQGPAGEMCPRFLLGIPGQIIYDFFTHICKDNMWTSRSRVGSKSALRTSHIPGAYFLQFAAKQEYNNGTSNPWY